MTLARRSIVLRRSLLIAVWLVCLAHQEVASASTVTVRSHPEPVYGDEVVYVAARGERNDVTVREVGFGGIGWEVRDPGARITARAPCWLVDPHTARCNAHPLGDPIGGYRVRLGDRDDRLRMESTTIYDESAGYVVADGGPGDDVLHGSETGFVLGDVLIGGGGQDRLYGEGGPDELSDGDRSHGRGEAGPGRDILDGGSGLDTVSYRQRTEAVTVDLAKRNRAGEPRERDVVTDVESIVGGRGNDRLLGDHRDNALDGRGGANRLVGRGGADELISGASISCGSGPDTVRDGDRHADRDPGIVFVEPDCEAIDPWRPGPALSYPGTLPPYPAKIGRAAVYFRLMCPLGGEELEEITACSGRFRLTLPSGAHRLLGRGGLPRSEWDSRLVKVALTPLGRLLARRAEGVRASVGFSGSGFPPAARWSITLKVR